MQSRIRISLYGMMIALLALASAFTVIPARADDGAPPPPVAPSGPSAKTANAPSVLSNVPAGTDVVVVNRSGHKVALASQQAADIVASGDPIWCPTGVAPKPGLGGCTALATSFNSLVNGLLLNMVGKGVNGTIWIESSPTYTGSFGVEGGPITLGGGLGTTVNHALTINGGWNGISGSTLLNPNAPSVFNVPMVISWNNSVTLNNLTFTGAAGTGLSVFTPGNVVLNNVDAISNTGNGAIVNTSSSTGLTGTVTVNYSTFTGNTSGDGLNIYAKRAVSLKNVNAADNSASGVIIDNTPATSAQPVTISGVNNFYFNGIYGMRVLSNGAITIGNVNASYNAGNDGVYLDNCNFDAVTTFFCTTPGSFGITLKGSNNFNNNGLDGLEVWASGAITTNNLTANDNGTALTPSTIDPLNSYEYGSGVSLDNYGTPLMAGSPITLNGTNSFTGNGSTGLYLDSYGAIKVNNITANENGLNSNCLAVFLGSLCDGTHVDFSKSFTLTGYGTFNFNGDDGLDALSYAGSMTLANVSADSNTWWGIGLNNCLFDDSGSPAVCHGTGNVTITGTNAFTNNGYTGLNVYTAGTVSLTNINASFNGLASDPYDGAGAWIDNCNVDTVTSHTCVVTVPKPVTLSGVNTFNGNNLDGLDIISLGAITVKQVTANDNFGRGAHIDNQWGFKNFNITLSGNNVFNTNGLVGLLLSSNGSIILSNITANENTGETLGTVNVGGAYMDNFSMTAVPVAITLTGINTFNNNGDGISGLGSGLDAYSDGAITISNLTANNNQENGAVLDNMTNHLISEPVRNITLTGVNTFMNNLAGNGLSFGATGAVTLTQVTADGNTSDGVRGTAGTTIMFNCGSLYLNGLNGYDLTGTTITLKGVYTDGPVAHSVTPIVTRACPIP